MKQGDPLSSTLFNCLLEEIFRNLEWEGKGIRINGSYLDKILFAKNAAELETMLKELEEESEKAGLGINVKKTKIPVSYTHLTLPTIYSV